MSTNEIALFESPADLAIVLSEATYQRLAAGAACPDWRITRDSRGTPQLVAAGGGITLPGHAPHIIDRLARLPSVVLVCATTGGAQTSIGTARVSLN